MSAPERIWIDHHGGNWSPVAGGTQEHEYIRADLAPAAPNVKALVEAAKAVCQAYWDQYGGIIPGMCDLDRALADLEGGDA